MPTLEAPKEGSIDHRLTASLSWHWRQDDCYREEYADILRSYAGRTTYPENKRKADASLLADKREIVNLTLQAVESYTLAMSANRPRANFSSPFEDAQPFAAHFQRNMDRYLRTLSVERVFQEVVRDACLMVGVSYVHNSGAIEANIDDPAKRYEGRPFISRIPLKRLVRDTEADTPEEAQFIGHLFSLPYEQAIRDPRFPKWAKAAFRESGPDDDPEEDAAYRGQGPGKRIVDVLNFCNVYIPARHEIRTYWVDVNFEPRLRRAVQRVKCRTHGCPYHFLNLGPVPDNFFPTSPALNLKLLNDLYNSIYRKLEDQARRQKQVMVGMAADKEDLKGLADTEDGEGIGLNNPQSVQMQRFDGPDQNLFGMLMNTQQTYSRAAGNLDARLGLGQSGDTASQERMIGAMASRLEAYQQQRFVAFARANIRDLAKLVYEHPTLEINGSHRIGFQDIEDSWRPGRELSSRPADFDAMLLDIDPYSMAYKSPQERAGEMDAEFQMFAPAFGLFAQQGIQFDLKAFVEERARLKDAPYLRQIWKYNQPPSEIAAEGGGPKPQREYIHRNVSGGGNGQQDIAAMFQAPQGDQ